MPKKQKDGRYRTKIKVGVQPDGKPLYKYLSGSTKAELEAERQKAIAYYIDASAARNDQLFGAYALNWYATYKKPFIAPGSQVVYRAMLNGHVLPDFGERNLRAITPDDLQKWLNQFAGRSAAHIAIAKSIMTNVFKSAVRDKIIQHSPANDLISPKAAPPEAAYDFSLDDRKRIETVAATHPEGIYLALLYYTGLRPGEARGLLWGDIDFDANMLHVQRDLDYAASGRGELGDVKTRAANRHVPLALDLRELLLPQRGLPTATVITGARGAWLSKHGARDRWIRLMQACGLADEISGSDGRLLHQRFTTRCTPHDLRHNFITMCWESGMDVYLTMRIVGHKDIAVTREIYTTLSARHVEKAKEELDAMFRKNKVAKKLPNGMRQP